MDRWRLGTVRMLNLKYKINQLFFSSMPSIDTLYLNMYVIKLLTAAANFYSILL